jgi:glycosyltransferase involved in cell wall biosynthesis
MKVSVIMAAYDRSNVLRYAVESLLRSSLTDWELLVIGDACTDDTEDVVASFDDPRIHFYNMKKNCGEQSGPNNEGLRRAQGEYVAFLSQDDMWFPDHLENLLAAVQQNDADGALAAGAVFVSDDFCILRGIGINRYYSPWYGAAGGASLWLIKHSVLQEAGGWRAAKSLVLPPSQDVLIRLWNSGKKLINTTEITAIIIPSGARLNSYKGYHDEINARLFYRMTHEPDFREKLYQSIAVGYERKRLIDGLNLVAALYNLGAVILKKIGRVVGVFPVHLYYRVKYVRKGRFINVLRRRRGLPPLP